MLGTNAWLINSLQSLLQAEQEVQQCQHLTDAIGTSDAGTVQAAWQQLLHERWKRRGVRARVPGLPPAFARRPGCPEDPAQLVAKVYGNAEWRGVKAWRRKLLHYPADGCRPPFYGSFSRQRCAHNVSKACFAMQADMHCNTAGCVQRWHICGGLNLHVVLVWQAD